MDASEKKLLMKRLHESVHRNVDHLFIAANYILAVLMIGYGILEPYSYTVADIVPEWNQIIGFTALVVFGVAIILFSGKDLMRSAGMYALALGIYRFMYAAPHIHRGEALSTIYLILALIGLNLIITGISYLRGTTRGRIVMMVSTSLLIVINASTIIYGVHIGMSLVEYIQTMPGTFVMIVMYLVLLGILNCEQLRSRDLMEIHNRTLDKIRCTWCTMPNAYIPRDVARKVASMFVDRSGWTRVSDGGPVECEYRFQIGNQKDVTHVLMQKWKGYESIFLTISDHLDGTLLHAYRFEATSVAVENDDVSSGTWMRLNSDVGTCLGLEIRDSEEDLA